MKRTKLKNKLTTKKEEGFAKYLKENKTMPEPLTEDIVLNDLWGDNDFENAFSDVLAAGAHALYNKLVVAIGEVQDWMTPSTILGGEKEFVASIIEKTKDETFAKKSKEFKGMVDQIELDDVRPTKQYYTKAMAEFLK